MTPPIGRSDPDNAERQRLAEDAQRARNWKRWGPYLSDRQWGTVREDYSAGGDSWTYFTHEQARSRAYRWGEDGLLGFTDRECRLCFALALWNERDPLLKERLFGLTNPEGNHGEDVKECYFHLDATPTFSYAKALYKYPQAAFPYDLLRTENHRRGRGQPEFEILDTHVFDDNRYFDVAMEYAKHGPDDVLIRITVANRGPEPACLHVLPTLWFRNTWSWGDREGDSPERPRLTRLADGLVQADHPSLGRFFWAVETDGGDSELLFTENETNVRALFGGTNPAAWVKDGFHEYVVNGRRDAVNPAGGGTKAAAHRRFELPAGGAVTWRLRLYAEAAQPITAFDGEFESTFDRRRHEGDAFYAGLIPAEVPDDLRTVARRAYAGLLWSRQFYHYVVQDWLDGDPGQPPPPAERRHGRNADWPHVFSRDVLAMSDKWEYPWFAAWDVAFHMIPTAHLDPDFAKRQLNLLLREWYMHPNGQIPAYEYNFSDTNPPVHAWACWRVYKMTGRRDERDRVFLARVFQKLLLNFTWWVNRKDVDGRQLFAGGFLGLDNIGVFDRSQPLPDGGRLEQADGTAWMAFYCGTMLSIALELAEYDRAYEDIASKFFEHFVAIADAMNHLGGTGLWNEEDGFYYDQMLIAGAAQPVRLRTMVGLIPLFAVEVIAEARLKRLPGFAKRTEWFLKHRRDLAEQISYLEGGGTEGRLLLAIPSRSRLERVLRYVLDENEFLSPFGIRSLSRVYRDRPFVQRFDGVEREVRYVPGESDSGLFGGNSNWRGPVWFPVNYLLIEALERYHHYYGDGFTVEFPTGSGRRAHLGEVAADLARRLIALFLANEGGRRPCYGMEPRYASDPHWRDLLLFHEYFHGETGQGLGAAHQTGWTALVTRLIEGSVCSR